MIPQRHQKQGKRLDNGEYVRGKLVEFRDGRFFIIDDKYGADIGVMSRFNCVGNIATVAIDPDTVEDVAVEIIKLADGKPITEKYNVADELICPNCNNDLMGCFSDGDIVVNHCPVCGQRLKGLIRGDDE